MKRKENMHDLFALSALMTLSGRSWSKKKPMTKAIKKGTAITIQIMMLRN